MFILIRRHLVFIKDIYTMFSKYPLFQSHIDLAHHYWNELIAPGDTVIDATCGNGHDSLVLAQLALNETKGNLFCYDIQEEAIQNSSGLLKEKLPKKAYDRIFFINSCHSSFPDSLQPKSVKLIVYNLGYLPGGNKAMTTHAETTWQSISNAMDLVIPGGAISITFYPGHEMGKLEQDFVLDKINQLDARQWSCCHHQWLNRKSSPNLLLLQMAEL